MKADKREFAHQVIELVEAIRPLLAGKPPELQSAALADLTSMWLCGLVILGEPDKTKEMREWAFANFMGLVKSLSESGVNEPKGGNN